MQVWKYVTTQFKTYFSLQAEIKRLKEREAKWRELEEISDAQWNGKTGIERRQILARIDKLKAELMGGG